MYSFQYTSRFAKKANFAQLFAQRVAFRYNFATLSMCDTFIQCRNTPSIAIQCDVYTKNFDYINKLQSTIQAHIHHMCAGKEKSLVTVLRTKFSFTLYTFTDHQRLVLLFSLHPLFKTLRFQ